MAKQGIGEEMHVHVQLHQKAALVTGSTDGFEKPSAWL